MVCSVVHLEGSLLCGLAAKAEKRALAASHTEFLEQQAPEDGQLTEQQVQLLTRLRGVVNDRITLAGNYRSLIGFALYIALYPPTFPPSVYAGLANVAPPALLTEHAGLFRNRYFYSVYTQRDTSRT